MTDADLRELLRDELPALIAQAVAEALAAQRAHHPHARTLAALGEVFGAGCAFSSADVLEVVQTRLQARQALREALEAALAGKALTSDRIGRHLGAIVRSGGTAAWRLTTPAADGNARLWVLEAVGGQGGRSP